MALSASFPRSTPTSQLQQQARSPSSLQSSLPPSQSPSSSSFLTSASSPSSSPQPPQGMVGNDRLDPTRLTLNNGINHGDYIIGPLIQPVNGTPVRNISEYIAKRDGTDEFVVLKVLTLNGSSNSGGGGSDSSEQNEDQGRMLLYNELSILSLLQDQPGVVHQHGFFREKNYVILVLDCLVGHEYDKDGRYKHFENLQHYVIREKKLCEREALEVFGSTLATVDALHQKNIVHRDLKLGNMILNKRTREVILTNFVLSRHLVRDGEELSDQRGSLAYVSPDVLSGQPYCGKASDMWAMGVLLYTMVYGQFPFYDNDPQELFRKIKKAKYTIPRDEHVSMETVLLIKEMMEVEPKRRISARRALDTTHSILGRLSVSLESDPSAQIVPEMSDRLPTMQSGSLPSTSPGFTHLASTALQLSLNPLFPDSHTTLVSAPVHPVASIPFQGSPVHVTATSPVHSGPISFHTSPLHTAGGQQLILNSDLSSAYLLTPLASTATAPAGSPFVAPPPPPSPSNSFLNASPTHSIGSSSSPINIPTSPTNTHSLPSTALIACHRPVAPSHSVDSYFTSHHPNSPSHSGGASNSSHMRPTALFSPQHSRNLILPSVSESGRSSENISGGGSNSNGDSGGSNLFVMSSPLDSIVTVRSTYRSNGNQNRHSYTSGDVNLTQHTPTHPPTHTHPPTYRRRNSSGDLNSTRVQRSSQGGLSSPSAALEATSLGLHAHVHAHMQHTHHGRTRRRSHDHNMDRDDNFGPLGWRSRLSRSSSREPYNINPQ